MSNVSTNLDQLARIERLEYFRRWRAANKDKTRQHTENYWRRRAEKRQKKEEQNGTGQNAD